MFGIITSQNFSEDIQNAVEYQHLFIQEGTFSNDQFIKHCKEAARIDLKVFIVDLDSLESESFAIDGIRALIIARPKVRVVLIAVDRKVNNPTISQLVGLGVYDIIAPSLPEENESENEIEIDIETLLKQKLATSSTYADVARWHNLHSHSFESKKTQKIKKEKKIVHTTETIKLTQIVQLQNTIISVVNISEQAGSSTITCLLADLIKQFSSLSVTINENPLSKPFLADYSGILFNLEESQKEFHSVIEGINKEEKQESILFREIHWNVLSPRRKTVDWTVSNTLDLLLANHSNISIYDIGVNFENDSIKKILEISKYILVVIEPHPTRMSSNVKSFQYFLKLKEEGLNVLFVANKWDSQIPKKDFIDGLGFNPDIFIHFIDPIFMYKYLYHFKPIIKQNHEIKLQLFDEFSPLLTNVIPKEILKNNKRKNFPSMIKKFFKVK